MADQLEIKPIGYDKNGPKFQEADLVPTVVHQIEQNNYFKRKVKMQTKDIDEATKLLNTATDSFLVAMRKLSDTEKQMQDETKRVSGKIRDTTNKLAEGLIKMEKSANFDKLERYVELLERAEKSMSALADLEKSGKLEKISTALK